jgi:hypothetical protein
MKGSMAEVRPGVWRLRVYAGRRANGTPVQIRKTGLDRLGDKPDFYQNKVGLTLSPEAIKNHLLFECGSGTTLLGGLRPR